MKKYVKCSICGKPLYLGEKALIKKYYVGAYCSPNCFSQSFNIGCYEILMDEEKARKLEVSVYDNDAEKDEEIVQKQLYDLLFIIRQEMTSITRYVRYDRSKHPNLTEGQSLDRSLEYKALAMKAVDNILNYINGEGNGKK